LVYPFIFLLNMKQPLLALLFCFALPPTISMAQRSVKTEFEQGTMDKGKKVGVWEYYNYSRNTDQPMVVQKYDHTNNKLLYYLPVEPQTYEVEKHPGDWSMSQVDQPPIYIGGTGVLSSYISQMKYPETAQQAGVQGKVIISFTIDTLGRATGHKVTKSIGGGCDQEALRTCQSIPNQWLAPRVGSKAVAVRYMMPFSFKLDK